MEESLQMGGGPRVVGEEGEPVEEVGSKEGQREQHTGHFIDAGDGVGLNVKLPGG